MIKVDEQRAVSDGHTSLAQNWYALQVLHDRIDTELERALQQAHELSVREYSLLNVLSRQHDGIGGHLQMKELATSVALSQSATTRLVARLEDRGLLARYICPTDRRGIYTDVSPSGLDLLEAARPTNNSALGEALDSLSGEEEFSPLVDALRASRK